MQEEDGAAAVRSGVLACVISWQAADQLDGVLASLAAQTHPDLDVVVVDNASTDGSADVARRHDGVLVVANARNRGYAEAANQAVDLAESGGHAGLLICNADLRLQPDYVARAVAALDGGARRASVQGRLWRLDPALEPAAAEATPVGAREIDTTGHLAFRTRLFRNRGEGAPDAGAWEEPGEVFGTSGAVALYRVAALRDVALRGLGDGRDGAVFDPDLFAFWEDVDLDWRLQLRGWQAWYEPTACGWHERGGAGARRSPTVERLNFANRLHVVVADDDLAALVRALPGVGLTTLLKAVDLGLTVPSALVAALGDLRRLPRTLRKRRVVQARATVPAARVAARWFGAFDYGGWVRTWWRRLRSAAGS